MSGESWLPSDPEGMPVGGTSDRPSVPLSVATFAEGVRVLYQKATFAVPTNLLNAALLIAVLWSGFDHFMLAIWGAANATIALGRLALVVVYKRKPRSPEHARQWANAFVVGSLLSGISWGVVVPLFSQPDVLTYRVFELFILGGLCAGSTASASSSMASFVAFNVPVLLPATFVLLLSSERVPVAMGAALALFGAAMATLARASGASFEESVRLRFEAHALRREREASLKQKEILLKEVHHRVKNNLQMISSLFNLQAEFITDPAVLEIFRESQARIRAIATVHQRLYQSSDLSMVDVSGYLRALVVDLRRTFAGQNLVLDISIDVEPMGIGIDLAIPCGLAVNELVTNAIKHAFVDRKKGTIKVDGKKISDGILSISVADDGIGMPRGFDLGTAQTLGLQLVYVLTKQMKGKVVLHREGGTRFELQLRVEQPAPVAADLK
jgi:two-component sensor histidine kinase